MGIKINLTGRKFGRLLVIKEIGRDKWKKPLWFCLCDCGNKTILQAAVISQGHTRSCGCLKISMLKERTTTHGMSDTRPYGIWEKMKDRCQNPNNTRFHDYGGRGIKVCPEWQTFEGFWKDMRPAYKPGLSIDRIDPNGDYESGNCRWATPKEQSNNTRFNRLLTFNGQTLTLAQWAREVGINYSTLRKRIDRDGWQAEKALTSPTKKPAQMNELAE